MRCLARYLVLSGSVLRISGVPDRIGRISQGLSAGHLKTKRSSRIAVCVSRSSLQHPRALSLEDL